MEPNPAEQVTIEGTYLFYYWIKEQMLTVLFKKHHDSEDIRDRIQHLVVYRHLEMDGAKVVVDKLWYASPRDGPIYVFDEGVLDEQQLALIREHLPVRMIGEEFPIPVWNAPPLQITNTRLVLPSSEKAQEWWKRVEKADWWPKLDATHNTGHITDPGTNEVAIAWERPPALAFPPDRQSPSPINQFVVVGLESAVKHLRVKRHSRSEAGVIIEEFRRSNSPAEPVDWRATLYLHWLLPPGSNVEHMEVSEESDNRAAFQGTVDVIVAKDRDREVELITMAHLVHAPSMQRFIIRHTPIYATRTGQSGSSAQPTPTAQPETKINYWYLVYDEHLSNLEPQIQRSNEFKQRMTSDEKWEQFLAKLKKHANPDTPPGGTRSKCWTIEREMPKIEIVIPGKGIEFRSVHVKGEANDPPNSYGAIYDCDYYTLFVNHDSRGHASAWVEHHTHLRSCNANGENAKGRMHFYYWERIKMLSVAYMTYDEANDPQEAGKREWNGKKPHHFVIYRHAEIDDGEVLVDQLWYRNHLGIKTLIGKGVLDENLLKPIRNGLPVKMIVEDVHEEA